MDELIKNLETETEESTKKLIESFRKELAQIRTNRPTPLLVEEILVDCYDSKMPIKQLAAISVIPPREIDIQPWDKNILSPIAKAIEASNLNISPAIDGNLVRINLPVLSAERRQELATLVKKIAEEIRIKIRARRDESKKKINQYFTEGKIGEDSKFKSQEKIQKIIDQANGNIERILEEKIKEINQ